MQYRPRGVCSQMINFDIEDNKVKNVSFIGGCNGNLQGISRLIEGMDVDEAISRIEGIRCGFKSTSCPDQLAMALKEATGRQYPVAFSNFLLFNCLQFLTLFEQ